MPSSPFIPRADNKFLAWATQFVHGIQASPYTYGLAPADAAMLMQTLRDCQQAMAVAQDDNTRTKISVTQKDDARRSLEDVCRRYAALIRPICGASDADKKSLGVRPRNASHALRKAPSTSPELVIVWASNGEHEVGFHDSIAPSRKAKPFGATALELWFAISDGLPTPEVEESDYVCALTRNSGTLITHAMGDVGRTATYWGRWVSRRGDVGPWSNPVSRTIARGDGTQIVKSTRSKAKKATGEKQRKAAEQQSQPPVRMAA